jgi:hypothetical protein
VNALIFGGPALIGTVISVWLAICPHISRRGLWWQRDDD